MNNAGSVSAADLNQNSSAKAASIMPFKALIFDLDGTLYLQPPLRRSMAFRMLRSYARTPAEGIFAMRAIRSFRKAQEEMRRAPAQSGDIAQSQLRLAAAALGVEPHRIATIIERWMEREPLALLASCRRKGLIELLTVARNSRMRLAICSDYPASAKLRALGIADYFDVVVCAQDRDVQRFKPDPAGLVAALRRLGSAKEEVLYIGDRRSVDGIAAERAGIRHVIISPREGCGDLIDLVSAASPASFGSLK